MTAPSLTELIDGIKTYENQSQILEPDANTRARANRQVMAHAETFLNSLPQAKAYQMWSESPKLTSAPITDEPMALEHVLTLLQEQVEIPGANTAAAGFLAYIPGGGIYHAALGDYLAAISNRYAGHYFSSPGAVQMENMLIRWACDLLGFPEDAGGNLTTGGSLATLIALITARDSINLQAKDFHRAVVYLSDETHHAATKALRLIGMQEVQLRYIPSDPRFRMQTALLDEAIQQDRMHGLIPWLVVASAGTVNTGAVDDLKTIHQITNRHRIWFHVDAAYGGFFILTEQGKRLFAGIEFADSVILDPHKSLFIPYGLGIVLIRNQRKLIKSFQSQANYIQDFKMLSGEPSPNDLSPELTKHFRGLRLWLPLKVLGVAPFRAALEEKLLLTQYFYERVKQMPGFEVVNDPQLSIVAFRYVSKHGNSDAINTKIIEAFQQDGRIFLTSTRLNGRYFLRMACLSFRTHLETIDLALQLLQKKVAAL